MDKLLSGLLGWKGYALSALGGAVLAASAAWFVTATFKNEAIAELKLEDAQKDRNALTVALAKLSTDIGRINMAAIDLGRIETALSGKIAISSRDLRNAIAQRPLPASCPPIDADRLRAVNAAIRAANDAAAGR